MSLKTATGFTEPALLQARMLVAPKPAPWPPALTESDVRLFREEGYLVVPEVCDAAQLVNLRTLLSRLFLERTGREEGNQFDMLGLDSDSGISLQPQIVNPHLYAPALLLTSQFGRIQAIARHLLGPQAEFSFDHSILKPAHSASATPWHQDEAYDHNPDYHHAQVSFWIPLQDVSETNGCMLYLPRSNLGPLLPHRSLNDDLRVQAIECPGEYFEASGAVSVPIAAGWCVLHDGRTLHSAMPNNSDGDRLAYVLAFRGPPVEREEPLHLVWLETRRTAGIERSRHWRSHGGYWVLMLRMMRRNLHSDLRQLLHKLAIRLRRLAHRSRAGLRRRQRGLK